MDEATSRLFDYGALGIFCFVFLTVIGIMLRLQYTSLIQDKTYLINKVEKLEEYCRSTLNITLTNNSAAFVELKNCIERSHKESSAALDRLTETLKKKQ